MEKDQNVQACVLGHKGMTLIEVMVASVIFLVGILGIASLQIHAIKANARAFDLTEGATLLGDRIEQLLSATWTEKTTDGVLSEINSPHSVPIEDYTVEWTVTDSPDDKSKTIELEVSWVTAGDTHTLSQVVVRSQN
ncbi:prepilin-type N-terminal cleavage/methylation domain-containing protein [Desulfoluna sp.]|uniref:type IV pilus modification PilV family protein n=1 Tax=Desulfoluna sp. TaxID=2045199 RepID=UPI00263035CD|nr:prepilin-type N-terminal cleavage/methylation domain-containing protein [Desulfoluna sp.]